jgi:hypothetical protein
LLFSPSLLAASIICARQPGVFSTSSSGSTDGKRLVADDVARAPHRVAEAERRPAAA